LVRRAAFHACRIKGGDDKVVRRAAVEIRHGCDRRVSGFDRLNKLTGGTAVAHAISSNVGTGAGVPCELDGCSSVSGIAAGEHKNEHQHTITESMVNMTHTALDSRTCAGILRRTDPAGPPQVLRPIRGFALRQLDELDPQALIR
jgi:hypothetical protein